MNYIEIKKKIFKKMNELKKELMLKVFKDAGLKEAYCEENLWAEIIEFHYDHVKIIGSAFTFFMYIRKGLPDTHIIKLGEIKELNSNSYENYDDRFLNYLYDDIDVANKIIKSILNNKEHIAQKAFELYALIDVESIIKEEES